MTIPGGYIAGEVLTAANMNLLPAGVLDTASVTANQGSITTVVDLTSLAVTWTAVTGRTYRVSFNGRFTSNVANDVADAFIATSGDTAVATGSTTVTNTTGAFTIHIFALVTGSGSVTYKARSQRGIGTGNVVLSASATSPATITVEDLGPTPA